MASVRNSVRVEPTSGLGQGALRGIAGKCGPESASPAVWAQVKVSATPTPTPVTGRRISLGTFASERAPHTCSRRILPERSAASQARML